jgi:hypothetical protein
MSPKLRERARAHESNVSAEAAESESASADD